MAFWVLLCCILDLLVWPHISIEFDKVDYPENLPKKFGGKKLTSIH